VVSSGSIDHDLRAALEVYFFYATFKDLFLLTRPRSENMEALTHHPRFLFMTAPLISFYCQTGRIKLPTKWRMTHHQTTPRGLISWPLSTRPSNLARGRKVSFGGPVHRSVISHRLSSTTVTMLFQRSVPPVSLFGLHPLHALTF
jgi:hypothetical protein